MTSILNFITKRFALMLFGGAVLGAIAGIIVGPSIEVIKPLGTIFTRLLSMIVPLIVFFSIASSFANIGEARKLGKYAGKILGYFMMTTTIATILGIIVGLIFKPGTGMSVPTNAEFEVTEISVDMFIDWIPANMLGSIAEGNIIQIVVLAMFMGFAVLFMVPPAKEHVAAFLNTGQDLILTIVKGIMYYAPIGIFALMANSIAAFKGSLITEMTSFLVAYSIAFVAQVVLVYMGLFWFFTRLNPITFTRKLFPALITAFTTTSSAGTMAVTLQNVKDMGVDEEIADFAIPLGVTFNMDSMGIEIPMYVMLGMYAIGENPTIANLIQLAILGIVFSIGTAGIPGGGLAVAVILVNAFGLPIEVVAWISAVFFYLDITGTPMNIWGDAVCATIVAKSENMLDLEKFHA